MIERIYIKGRTFSASGEIEVPLEKSPFTKVALLIL